MGTYQYDFVKRLSFLRFGGTDNERNAADILLSEIEKWGGDGNIEAFQIPGYRFHTYSLKVTAPYVQEYEVFPYGLSGSFPAGGVDLKFLYVEDCTDADLYDKKDLSDTVVLSNVFNLEAYKALCQRNAAAILVMTGKWYDSKDTADFLRRHIRPAFLEHGKIPTFFLWAKDAMEMVKNEAQMLHIELEQEEFENTTCNVVATIPGRQITEESVVITAHYDSVTVGTGAWDNATGAATAMYLYRHFLKNPPRRTMHFIWCGSEEQGLCGSKAYIAAHPEQVEKEIQFGFNFDMCGTALGNNKVCVTGGEELKHYAQAFCKEYGWSAAVYQDVRSSDSAPFADRGIPTLDLFRACAAAEIHTRHDLIDILSPGQLKKDGDFAVAFIERVVNAARLPVGLGMPEDIKEKLDKYFLRKSN